MLHYTPSPATAHFDDYYSDDASSDLPDEPERAEFKLRRRNYCCVKCQFYTQNPRTYLEHTRDVHLEKIKIYECTRCIYASKFQFKLQRHLKMVHGIEDVVKVEIEPVWEAPARDEAERIEDLLEEVEEVDDDDHDDAPDNGHKVKKEHYMCKKCSYVTHVRSRYTKHVKYHSMPMIKCVICDFRTPYKWNLDRHMKNHGGTGAFHCSMCNFTADIKQSLTVHEMNHHASSAGQSVAGRRRNRVGASDIALADKYIELEEEGSSDSAAPTPPDMVLQSYSDKEMGHSDSNDASSQMRKELNLKRDHSDQESPTNTMDEGQLKQKKKPPRPLPQLIPLNTSTPTQSKPTGEPPLKKFKESSNDSIDSITKIPDAPTSTTNNKETTRNKNQSFFDRLKERILTESGEEGSLVCKNCGFASKCLSEHSVHEKNCTALANKATSSTLLPMSTRCKNCRHRCKSSADLITHMKTCQKSNPDNVTNETIPNKNDDSLEIISTTENKQSEPHPMENKVFVWNNFNIDTSKFDTPLGISINDDSTLPDRSFDAEMAEDNEGMNLSPSQAIGKKVFKCPHCQFWASTASRFHVHIVGHLNKKPFECSLCKYKSNWRWDITKHIKLKSARDPFHNDAKVLMTDETGRRNYSKYNKFLAMPVMKENGSTGFQYIDPNASSDLSMEVDDSYNEIVDQHLTISMDMQPLNLQTQHFDQSFGSHLEVKKPKKTLWKCKKCNYKDSSKEALLEHVREHSSEDSKPSYKKPDNLPDPADLAYRCGHCNQLSNWKHVIQRHCRLKHDGIIKVITTVKPKPEELGLDPNEVVGDTCNKCPFKSEDKQHLLAHLQQHQPSAQSIFKCYFCHFFVKNEIELTEHLLLHGITDPEEYIQQAKGCKSPMLPNETPSSNKRHKCTECPYETNSKSQYQYHEQFHRLPADTQSYKCPECNYSVSKRHLLHQHLRVHGIIPKKSDIEDHDVTESISYKDINLEEIPFVWVSAKDEFHKMFKCRYCSYVNSQECNISTHEKIHCNQHENSDVMVYKCLECKFACRNARVLALHSKSHGEIYGRIYCPVEADIPEDEQIAKLRKVIEIEKQSNENSDNASDVNDGKEMRVLYFCQKCPARYFNDKELKFHDKLHDFKSENKCENCMFSTAQESYLAEHATVHTDEYNTKTKILKFTHNYHLSHQPPSLTSAQCPTTSTMTWTVGNPGINYEPDRKPDSKSNTKFYPCKECPAKFYKSSALNYHTALHNGEGDYKCKKCSYCVKNSGNLTKHELLHENENSLQNCDFESGDDADYKNIPLSGTDLFQRKTEAQKKVSNQDKLVKPNDHFPPVLQADPQFGYLMHGNPDFVYPTYMKNGRQKEKRYKCHKCPSAFEKREQYKIHLSLHGSKQRYKCEICDYSVKYYANYVQHMRKHQMNDEAVAERKKSNDPTNTEVQPFRQEGIKDNIKLAIKTMPRGTPKTDFQQFAISDQQTLRLLQRRRSMNISLHDANNETSPVKDKDRKMHTCLLCPYKNQRQDALATHYTRHEQPDVCTSAGSHKCPYCGLVVVQTHFMRDHLKTHFSYQKNLAPECFEANENISFVLTKEDGENNEPSDLELAAQNLEPCNDTKVVVKILTGEIVV